MFSFYTFLYKFSIYYPYDSASNFISLTSSLMFFQHVLLCERLNKQNKDRTRQKKIIMNFCNFQPNIMLHLSIFRFMSSFTRVGYENWWFLSYNNGNSCWVTQKLCIKTVWYPFTLVQIQIILETRQQTKKLTSKNNGADFLSTVLV